MKTNRIVLALAIFTLCAVGYAQDNQDQKTNKPANENFGKRWIGVDVGAYIPTNGTIRDVYGTGIKIGLSPVTRIRSDKWHIDGDVNLIADSRSGAKLLLIPVNAALERSFGSEASDTQTFVRFSAGAVYNDHSFDLLTGNTITHYGTKTVGADAAVEVGAVMSRRWRLSARYNLFQKSDDFDFSGFTFSIQYAAFKF